MSTITEKTKIPLSLFVVIAVAIVSISAAAARGTFKVEEISDQVVAIGQKVERMDAGSHELDKRVQRLEDAFVRQQDMITEIRDDVKELKHR